MNEDDCNTEGRMMQKRKLGNSRLEVSANVRQLRLPPNGAALLSGEPEGESGRGRSARQDRGEEARDACTDRARLGPDPEAMDRADPGYHEAAPPGGESRRGRSGAHTGRSP